MIVLLLGFALSAVITFFIIRFERTHSRFSSDLDLSGPQKFHAKPVPRVGGIGIVIGLAVALTLFAAKDSGITTLGVLLMGCAAPAFLAGLAEDLTKSQSPRRRLFFTAVSASLAAWALGAVINRTDIPGLDWAVSFLVPAIL